MPIKLKVKLLELIRTMAQLLELIKFMAMRLDVVVPKLLVLVFIIKVVEHSIIDPLLTLCF